MWAATDTDGYAHALLLEAARLLSIRCPRCARARLRRIAQHDVETTGADFMEATRQRERELEEFVELWKSKKSRTPWG